MRRTEEALHQSIAAAHRFIEAHADQLSTVVESGAFRRLGEVLANLRELGTNQSGGAYVLRGATLRNEELRAELETLHMRPIARIAAILAMENIELKPLRMPSTAGTTQMLIAHARGMADMARKYKDSFVREGLPADFLERLDALTHEITNSQSGRKVRWADRGSATIGIRRELSTGRKLVRALDSLILVAARDNETLLAEWKSVKRVESTAPVKRAALNSPAALLALPAPSARTISATETLADAPAERPSLWPRFLRAMKL